DVYVAIYTMDADPDGHLTCYGFSSLDKVHDHIYGAILDSQWLADRLVGQYAYDPKRLHVVKHPTIDVYQCRDATPLNDVASGRPSPSGSKSAGDQLRVHWSGRIAPQKRPELAFEVCALIAKERLPIEVDIWGDGEAPVAFDMLPGVRWRGHYDDPQELADRYDVLLYTSRTDGASLTVLEAAAGGHAIVAPDTGATGIVEHGLPLTDDTPEALVAALRELLDSAKLKQAQLAARKAAAGRTWEAFVASLPEGYLRERKMAAGEAEGRADAGEARSEAGGVGAETAHSER
ncbi:MAG TPA: glycosyltransferase, partial [Polyangiaceae bacterium]|nr:glycosyltransferase [Polyangiaceae bacterium]